MHPTLVSRPVPGLRLNAARSFASPPWLTTYTLLPAGLIASATGSSTAVTFMVAFFDAHGGWLLGSDDMQPITLSAPLAGSREYSIKSPAAATEYAFLPSGLTCTW